MNKTGTRRENLRLLIQDAGISTLIIRRLHVSHTVLLRYTARDGRAPIGDRLARDLETRLGLEPGWLDHPHDLLPDAARGFARKWSLLPAHIRHQISDYVNSQIEVLPQSTARDAPGSRNRPRQDRGKPPVPGHSPVTGPGR